MGEPVREALGNEMNNAIEEIRKEIAAQSNCLTVKDAPSNAVVTVKQRRLLQVLSEIERLRDNAELDWNRLRSGNYRALDPAHQDVFDMVAQLRELLRDLLPEIDFADGELDPGDSIVVLRLRERVREALGE